MDSKSKQRETAARRACICCAPAQRINAASCLLALPTDSCSYPAPFWNIADSPSEWSAAAESHCLWCPSDCPLFRLAWSRSEEHTSELQSLMRISYAAFSLKKKTSTLTPTITQ